MATSFSANQYQNAFIANKLQNWETPKRHKQRPDSYEGFTQVIANDRGHLMNGVTRSKKNPWGDFVGTWDLPKKIPGHSVAVPTARCGLAQQKLQLRSEEANRVISGKAKNDARLNARDSKKLKCAVRKGVYTPYPIVVNAREKPPQVPLDDMFCHCVKKTPPEEKEAKEAEQTEDDKTGQTGAKGKDSPKDGASKKEKEKEKEKGKDSIFACDVKPSVGPSDSTNLAVAGSSPDIPMSPQAGHVAPTPDIANWGNTPPPSEKYRDIMTPPQDKPSLHKAPTPQFLLSPPPAPEGKHYGSTKDVVRAVLSGADDITSPLADEPRVWSPVTPPPCDMEKPISTTGGLAPKNLNKAASYSQGHRLKNTANSLRLTASMPEPAVLPPIKVRARHDEEAKNLRFVDAVLDAHLECKSPYGLDHSCQAESVSIGGKLTPPRNSPASPGTGMGDAPVYPPTTNRPPAAVEPRSIPFTSPQGKSQSVHSGAWGVGRSPPKTPALIRTTSSFTRRVPGKLSPILDTNSPLCVQGLPVASGPEVPKDPGKLSTSQKPIGAIPHAVNDWTSAEGYPCTTTELCLSRPPNVRFDTPQPVQTENNDPKPGPSQPPVSPSAELAPLISPSKELKTSTKLWHQRLGSED